MEHHNLVGTITIAHLKNHNFKCTHSFREAYCVADALSKKRHKISTTQIFLNIKYFPKESKAYYQQDLLEMPNFRRKKTKKITRPP